MEDGFGLSFVVVPMLTWEVFYGSQGPEEKS